MDLLLSLNDRSIYLVSQGPPAVYYILDHKAGGILINAPAFSPAVWGALQDLGGTRFLFLPSHFGVRDLALWRAAGVQVLAFQEEVATVSATDVDVAVNSQQKLTRTIDFLPMAGRTHGTCGLRLKNLPGVLFLGPALTPGLSRWPELIAHPDDYSYESRLMGVFGLRDLAFDYVFTDLFVPGETAFGPGADRAIRAHLDALLA
ncbi:MAG TPA: hypothetical protein VMV40_01735 [Acidiferrobacter sp.]|nr:hypothetical protein [Acidiferrobacter sp.]